MPTIEGDRFARLLEIEGAALDVVFYWRQGQYKKMIDAIRRLAEQFPKVPKTGTRPYVRRPE